MTEDKLIRRAQTGDQEAFRQLVELYATLTQRTARVLLADKAEAEDAVQEAWLDAWRSLTRFEAGRPFRPWLLTLLANRCRMKARRARLIKIPLDDRQLEELSADNTFEKHELDDAELQTALATLPPEQRQVLELRFFADLELVEIAALTGNPAGTIKSRLHRALKSLRTRLQPELSDELSKE